MSEQYLQRAQFQTRPTPDDEPTLSVSDLSISRGHTIIHAANFNAMPNTSLALIGPNGSGKTLLLQAQESARLAEFLGHIEPVSRGNKGLQNEAAIAKPLPPYDLEHVRVPTLLFGVENCLYNTYPAACFVWDIKQSYGRRYRTS